MTLDCLTGDCRLDGDLGGLGGVSGEVEGVVRRVCVCVGLRWVL